MENQKTRSGFVTIAGKPNAGKSSLVNTILGFKLSIVTHKAQTTRKNVLGIYSDDDAQIIFHDTPGILEPKYELHQSMMGFVEDSIRDTELTALIIDVADCKDPKDYFPEWFMEAINNVKVPKILILNKIDKIKEVKYLLPLIEKFSKLGIFEEFIPVSATKNSGVDELVSVFKKYMPESPFMYDPELLSTQSERFFVSEIIREHIFTIYHDELPYSSDVNITEFKERERGRWYINADIVIERESQKKIVIGEKGEQIKKLGSRARADIEEHLGREVYLELFVKIRPKWRNNKTFLKSFGY